MQVQNICAWLADTGEGKALPLREDVRGNAQNLFEWCEAQEEKWRKENKMLTVVWRG